MDEPTRKKLRSVVTQCRKLLEEAVAQELQGKFGISAHAKKQEVKIEDDARMGHLSDDDKEARRDIIDHYEHVKARGFKPKDAIEQLIREIAFTHLNRLCAYKMMEAREVYVGGQKFREAVSRGINSNGVKFYLADHPDDERLFNTGQQNIAYRHFLDWLGGLLSEEIGVLFNPTDPANRLYPPQRVLDQVIGLLNGDDIKPEDTELREAWPKIWAEDEAIGWVYQYFTPKELRDQARKQSSAPRNSYELAFRNQFFTPRYVVEFLTDNTLGRIWYEMRKGDTKLKGQCCYMVRRPNEIFLDEGEEPPADAREFRHDLSQEELLKRPVYIPSRPKKDPRELKILDPACGSGHFLLYCFDLLLTIYEESYNDPDLGPALQRDYLTLDDLRRDVPRLILAHNLHGIDIDLRCTQIAALALWLRCQRVYQETALTTPRFKITRSNIVCAEPMPGEASMLREFVSQLEPKLLGQLVEVVFNKMKLAGESGSLLQIDDEIQEAVAAAKNAYKVELRRRKDEDGYLPGMTPPQEATLFDFADLADDVFLDRAEDEIVKALKQYAKRAENGGSFMRTLFAGDAGRGFAFVDVCRKRFDVVLMNPPFGAPTENTKAVLVDAYSGYGNDIFAFFVARGAAILAPDGRLGAITNRTGFFTVSQLGWRENVLLGSHRLELLVDLGYGVLDALVETAAYVIASSAHVEDGLFHRAIASEDKHASIQAWLGDWRDAVHHCNSYIQHLADFRHLPSSRIAFWMPRSLLGVFRRLQSYGDSRGNVQVGLQTSDNFRFLRLAWEVDPADIAHSRDDCQNGKQWVYYAKGGEYAPYYSDIHLLVNWLDDGKEIKSFTDARGNVISYPRNERYYFQPGLTYSERTTSNLSVRIMPRGCCFDTVGPRISADDPDRDIADVAVFMTRPVAYLLEFMVGSADVVYSGSAARHYTPRCVAELPYPKLPPRTERKLSATTARIWELHRQEQARSETDRTFVAPSSFGLEGATLEAKVMVLMETREVRWKEILSLSAVAERATAALYGLEDDSRQAIEADFGKHPCEYGAKTIARASFLDAYRQSIDKLIDTQTSTGGASRTLTKKSFFANRRLELLCHKFESDAETVVRLRRTTQAIEPGLLEDEAASIISYAVGVVNGRWDVRFATGEARMPDPPGPFDPLPACPPGMLMQDDFPRGKISGGYPIQIEWDGVMVDDDEHKDDIVSRARDVLELVLPECSHAIEQQVCSTLGVTTLRDLFRKPGKGGFWDDHVRRYSKSRRKAPIYWLLQSSNKNYALWLYYHRLDKDMLFKALVNYVEPKIQREQNRLAELRSQRAGGSDSGAAGKKLDRNIEKQEDLLSELRGFEEKLRKAANLHLDPDLNDGVVLNIAPLHELVPWKVGKKYWDELIEGKYEWSSIGKQLREKGLVKEG